ncbi:RING/Ubox like zinc-binding domain-containing protein [Tribonema minus]|uniref:RING/Ubox like zinc-binding domain-containing protein n=1 Tax=Tribonema minus TaxID=303371 RepID=A0A835YKN6_9STRA|nr:RING/Ubox like zinc-binding domain-containing protein [Tribonema minus]
MSFDSDNDSEDDVCPLCCEELDLSDKNFLPCQCGYRVCIWCWHTIKDHMNGLCPACRNPYSDDPHAFAAVDRDDVIKSEKRKRRLARQHALLHLPLVQRNLVYVVGLPPVAASEEYIRRPEWFGQFGKINKVVANLNQGLPPGDARHGSASAYISFVHREDARACIHSVDGFVLEGRTVKANFGTTKYCNSFLRHLPCNNNECMYLHELGDEEVS